MNTRIAATAQDAASATALKERGIAGRKYLSQVSLSAGLKLQKGLILGGISNLSNWNVKWDEVSGQDAIIPEGKYTFEIAPGAKFAENGSLKASATLVNDGEFTGKRVFFSYPDPNGTSSMGKSFAWSKTAFKRLITALGEDPTEGESEDTYLNRVAGGRFRGQIRHRTSEGYPTQAELNLFNVEPSA